MADSREQMDRFLKQIEQEAYARGWTDAIAHLQAKVAELPKAESAIPRQAENDTTSEAKRPRGRPATAIGTVREIICAQPGLKGAEIVRESQRLGTPVQERTVRSCLRRLKGKHAWQREGRWYPKRKTESEYQSGEAPGTPPH